LNGEYLALTVGFRDQEKEKKKKTEKATLIPFVWGFFFCIQIIKKCRGAF